MTNCGIKDGLDIRCELPATHVWHWAIGEQKGDCPICGDHAELLLMPWNSPDQIGPLEGE